MEPRAALRPLTRDDLRFVHEIQNDPEAQYYDGGPDGNVTLDEVVRRFEAPPEPGRIELIIWSANDPVRIGRLVCRRLRESPLTYQIGIRIARDVRDRGYGQEAIRLVLTHLFGRLGAHRVELTVRDYNERGIACYKKCGFHEEGRRREAGIVEGRFYDDLIMSVLAREFHSEVPDADASSGCCRT